MFKLFLPALKLIVYVVLSLLIAYIVLYIISRAIWLVGLAFGRDIGALNDWIRAIRKRAFQKRDQEKKLRLFLDYFFGARQIPYDWGFVTFYIARHPHEEPDMGMIAKEWNEYEKSR
jgi:hypothetical protein